MYTITEFFVPSSVNFRLHRAIGILTAAGLLLFSLTEMSAQRLLSVDQINQNIEQKLITDQKVFDWNDASTEMLWSAIAQSDSVVAIGYQSDSLQNLSADMHRIDFRGEEWEAARQDLIQMIVDHTELMEDRAFAQKDLLLHSIPKKLPYFFIKIRHKESLEILRIHPQVRYLEPTGYTGFADSYRSGEGCAD